MKVVVDIDAPSKPSLVLVGTVEDRLRRFREFGDVDDLHDALQYIVQILKYMVEE